MAIGMMFSGVIAGFLAVVWSLIAGHSLWLALALYPLVGVLASLGFLILVVMRKRDAALRQNVLVVAEAR